MIVKFKISGQFIDKPKFKMIEIDNEQDAVQLPNGDILKVKQLTGDALDQYINQKYVEGSNISGRIIETIIER